MRIVHLMWSLNPGGAETMLVDIANEQSLSNEVIVVIGNTCVDRAVLDGFTSRVEVKLCGRPEGSRNPWFFLKLYRTLRRLNPDIIHAHNDSFIRITRFLDIPSVLTVHDTGVVLTSLLNRYDAIYSISKAVKKDLTERYPEITSTIIHNGIIFSSVIKKSHFRDMDAPFRIVQVSRLDLNKKGQDILLRALPYVNAAVGVGNVTVDFIGEGASSEDLVLLAKDLDIDKYCRFLGKRSRSYIYENLHNYDLLVQPSRFEGFGLTVIEAMAAMVPVLVSDIEGPMEIIENGRFGYYFISEDYEDCANQIINIKRQSKDQKFIEDRKNIAKSAKDRFELESTAKKYIDEYKNVVNSCMSRDANQVPDRRIR